MYVETALCEVDKGISVTKMVRHSLPSKSSLTIYKALLRPYIDYGDIIYV